MGYKNLLGTPYSEKNCWDIVVQFYKQVFGITLKNYYDDIPSTRHEVKSIIHTNMPDFSKIEDKDKKFGDIILIKLYGVESHIGVYLENDLMLHTTIHSGCVIERIARWRHLIVGYYRAVKDDTTS
jgi:cell wall-associated NlpC family hydrolase